MPQSLWNFTHIFNSLLPTPYSLLPTPYSLLRNLPINTGHPEVLV
ncbi:hypothetical protein [Moorena producens]